MTTKEIAAADLGGLIGEARGLVEDYVKAQVIEIAEPGTGVKALVVLAGTGVAPLPSGVFDQFRDNPRYRQGTAAMLSLDSFIEHANCFKDADSVVFANDDRTAPSLTAVIDYHEAGEMDESEARFGKHRSTFAFPLSDEWKAWTAADGKKMSMTDFAEFIEERVIDVLYLIPGEDELSEALQKYIDVNGGDTTIATPHRLVELSRGLQVHETSVIREVNKLSSGEGQVLFQTDHTDANGEPLKIPNMFLIGIPVFRNGQFYRLAARLRYRKTPAGIVFWYDLWRTDRTFDDAFQGSLERVKAETELPLLLGKPEA